MPTLAEKILVAFRELDPSDTGLIQKDELSRILKALALDSRVVDLLLHDYSKDLFGAIQYADFLQWITGSRDQIHEPPQLQSVYVLSEDRLGEGSYGTVRKATHRTSGAWRAVKTIRKQRDNASQKDELEEELAIMQQVDHPNIIKSFHVFDEAEAVHIAMELCWGGTLLDRLVEEYGFSEYQSAIVMHQLISAVCYLHSESICHRDLKPQNLLLGDAGDPVDQCVLKVADFGLARRFKDGTSFSEPVGSPSYAAPEVLMGSYTQACDLWSCGVIAYVLIALTPPFRGRDDAEVLSKVLEGHYTFDDARWSSISDDAKSFVRRLMEFDASKRCTASEAAKSSWICSTVQ